MVFVGMDWQKLRIAAAVWLLVLGAAKLAEADEWSSTAKLRSFYHVNAAGVGRFDWFIVPPDQLERFAPFAGRFIEVEIEASRAFDAHWDDSRRVLRKVRSIDLLRQPDVKFDLQVISPGVHGEGTCDLHYTVVNAGKADVVIDFDDLRAGFQQVPPPDAPPRPDAYLQSGYALHQLRHDPPLNQRIRIRNDSSPGHLPAVLLRPGEQAPFVDHHVRLADGRYEMIARSEYRVMEDTAQSIFAARVLTLPDDAIARRANSLKGRPLNKFPFSLKGLC